MVEFSSIFEGFDEVSHHFLHFRTYKSTIFETQMLLSCASDLLQKYL